MSQEMFDEGVKKINCYCGTYKYACMCLHIYAYIQHTYACVWKGKWWNGRMDACRAAAVRLTRPKLEQMLRAMFCDEDVQDDDMTTISWWRRWWCSSFHASSTGASPELRTVFYQIFWWNLKFERMKKSDFCWIWNSNGGEIFVSTNGKDPFFKQLEMMRKPVLSKHHH